MAQAEWVTRMEVVWAMTVIGLAGFWAVARTSPDKCQVWVEHVAAQINGISAAV